MSGEGLFPSASSALFSIQCEVDVSPASPAGLATRSHAASPPRRESVGNSSLHFPVRHSRFFLFIYLVAMARDGLEAREEVVKRIRSLA